MAGVTIYQVAEEAGVSPSTVSNLLNGRTGKMLPETRSRVESAIRRLGYRPNRAAQQLRTGRIQMLGLIVPSVANPFWGTFARHLEAAALAEGFYMLLCNSERDPSGSVATWRSSGATASAGSSCARPFPHSTM